MTQQEKELLKAYSNASETCKKVINKLLDIQEDNVIIFTKTHKKGTALFS